jgi:radical SAM superfamily enzyme YgiQ (UPF0313 family)
MSDHFFGNMNKIKIALILCPCWSNFCPSIGIAYLASMLKSEGYGIKCYDLNIELYNLLKKSSIDYWDFKNYSCWSNPAIFSKVLLPLLKKYLKVKIKEILTYNPEIIGLSVFDTNALTSLYVAEEIKKENSRKKIIFGGPECFKEKNSFKFLKSGFVDTVVIGEGEETLLKLLKKYVEKKTFENVKGSIAMVDKKIIDAGFREEIKNLDDLPYPDYSVFDIAQYKKNALPILTSRGCTARCSFCGEVIYWKKYRFRRAENIFEELKQSVIHYKIKEFFFNDSLINGNLTELSKLVDLIKENKMDIIWGGYARVDPKMDIDFLKKMKKAGCYFLSYGIESGSQKVLNNMNKHFLLKDAERNLKDTQKAGIETHVNWIVGFPTESWLDFLKSLIFIYKNRRKIFRFNPGQTPCVILPYSALEQDMDKFKIAKKSFLNSWRTRYFRNTIIHRNLRLKILRKWISLLSIRHS